MNISRTSTLDRSLPAAILLAAVFLLPVALVAQGPPCTPCAGVRVENPASAVSALEAEPRVEGEERLYVLWQRPLDGSASAEDFNRVLEAGGTPWLAVRFQAPAPIFENLASLETELEDLARLARGAGERAHFQIDWQPTAGETDAKDFAFLIKRAAVTITGSRADARVLIGPLLPNLVFFETLYDEEISAYVDGIVLSPGDSDGASDAHSAAIARLRELDPGKGIVLDSLAWPEQPERVLVGTAAGRAAGYAVTFFERPAPSADDLAPLKLLAREFQGDLSLDPTTTPSGAERAWAFVRGEDLSLRVIVETLPGEAVSLYFDDPQLKAPRDLDPMTGEPRTVFGQRRTTRGLVVPLEEPAAAALLSIERMSAAELEGIEGLESEVTVADARQMPVEEILRRLQAFEDAQNRRLERYQAVNTMHMRFSVGAGVSSSVEITLKGDFFYRRDEGFDWAWEDLYFNGTKWRRDKFPQLPIIQPEKAAALPLEILFTKEYRYRLRGTDTVEGRDTWVVDFAPVAPELPGRVLAQGTVWIDRELYARVKTRAVQVGLEGEDLSNEDTVFFAPLDATGQPTGWSAEAFVLPTRSTGQQILSILNSVTRVERETELQIVEINGDAFEERRQAVLDSDVTMVRDTDAGMRYLNKDEETGEREVQAEFDTTHLFLVGGVFYDAGLDFPVPLAGVNYLARKWRGRDIQVNGFLAGPLIIGNIAKPRLGKTKWDLGANVFGLFVSGEESVYRGDQEILGEEIESGSSARVNLFVGHPIGEFWKVDFRLGLRFDSFSRSDNTDENFILPEDTTTRIVETTVQYNRKGYNLTAEGSFNMRDDWSFWGLPGNTEFDPDQEDYMQWRVSAGKTWWLKNFRKFGLSIDHLNGSDLDRFSKWDFNFFSPSRVAGYQDGLVTADRATGLHLLYGIELGEAFRVQVRGDAVWATDRFNDLRDELLAGISLNGTTIGPWGTIINFDLGVPVEGPADDLVVFVAFLKLFG